MIGQKRDSFWKILLLFWKLDQQVECGICYAHCLPIDDELGTKPEIGTDYICNNSSCSKAFHSICLAECLAGHLMSCSGNVLIVQNQLQ
ncbi:E3 ubiquitin-protein ligase FANCL-like isoform X2 [Tripterygium wilfordii]|uniref:E3 ubiquitin-protein ligase FANCL-like isoform X2 n=1 Tax=Tripterygium wilfordii TaxID=458696 RepID=UPI0018F85F69|nr:E3 ubiquitin-protein ligase FANCL-like isoform X2 [Tripterygium wilfordii]